VTSTQAAEQSVIWVDQTGTLRRINSYGAGSAFKALDCDDGVADLIYTRLESYSDDDFLTNQVSVERLNLPDASKDRDPLIYSHAASINMNGVYALTETRLPLVDDTALANWAQRVLSLRAEPEPAIRGMEILLTDTFPWTARSVPEVIKLSVGSVLATALTSRGDPGAWVSIVASIQHTITPSEWAVQLELADGAAIALNAGYDHVNSKYDTTKYSGGSGVAPSLSEQIAAALAKVLEEIPA
jgi:hypothetical protein